MDTPLVPVLVSLFHPHPRTLSLALPSSTSISSLASLLAPYCPPAAQVLALSSGKPLPRSPSSTLATLRPDAAATSFVALRLTPRLPGGKGGFASQLRAQGGRMSSNKAQNTDSCRGLDGRRLSTLKEAKRLADALENEPDRLAAQALAKQKRLEELNAEIRRLEQQAGVAASSSSSAGPVASGSGSGIGSSASGAAQDGARPAPSAGGGAGGGKRRLDDAKYVEESKEIVSGVKDAVRAGASLSRLLLPSASSRAPSLTLILFLSRAAMMKKRKKAKTDAAAAPAATSATVEKEKENKAKAGSSSAKGKGKGKATEEDDEEAVAAAAEEA